MTPVGIVLALVAVVVSMTLDHGKVTDLIKIPAIILVLGGSLGATIAGFDKRRLRAVPKAVKLVMLPGQPPDMKGTIDTLLTMAREVRQNPLALEQLETDDAFLKMGIQVITSTSDPERVHELLGAEVDGLRTRHTTLDQVLLRHGGLLADLRDPRDGDRPHRRARAAHRARQARPGDRLGVRRHAVGRPSGQCGLAADLEQAASPLRRGDHLSRDGDRGTADHAAERVEHGPEGPPLRLPPAVGAGRRGRRAR